MSGNIHPRAVIHSKAELDASVVVGPYAIIDAHVRLGPDCHVGPLVHLTGNTSFGRGNRFHTGCVIGDAPQDIKYKGEQTELIVGDHNTFREHATVHRSNCLEEPTRIGSNNLLMAQSHVAHNVQLGDGVILVSGALIAGHAVINDGVFLSANAMVHQFTRIGTLALLQGGAAMTTELPPYTVGTGLNGMCGLNTVGLRRAGVSPAVRQELKRLYHILFRIKHPRATALAAAEQICSTTEGRILIDFVRTNRRGLCSDTSVAPQ